MDTIFIKCIYKRTSDPHRLLLNLTDKINLKRSHKYIPLSNLCIYYTWKNKKNSCKINRFKISAATCNEESYLHKRSFSVSDIQAYFEWHETVTDNHSIIIHVNKREKDSTQAFRIQLV